MMYVVREHELKECVGLDLSVIHAIEKGFQELQKGNATVPPIMMIPVPEKHGEVDIKAAYISGVDRLAVKVASGFFENNKLGLPSTSGLMLVLSARTGFLEGVLLDNGYLTQVRTAAAGAIAAKYLAPKKCDTAGVIGTGTQARFQMRALKLVRPYSKIIAWSNAEQTFNQAFVDEMKEELSVDVVLANDAAEVVKESSIVVTTTPARWPVIKKEWLHPGLHITAMGSDTEEKQELDPEILIQADIIACDMKKQCFRLGELRSAKGKGLLDEKSNIIELGELILRLKPGRRHESQISVCDLTGVGVQDTMIALKAFDLAKANNMGIRVD